MLLLDKHRRQKVRRISGIKCKIAYKEAEGTEYWLLLCKYAQNHPYEEEMLDDVQSILKEFGKIISSSLINKADMQTTIYLVVFISELIKGSTYANLHITNFAL